MIYFATIAIIIGIFIYRRYIPIINIPLIPHFSATKDMVILDVRDYQTIDKDPVDGALNIPYPYLNRYYNEIPKGKIVIIATDSLEKNLAIRFLKKRGYKINGFMIKA